MKFSKTLAAKTATNMKTVSIKKASLTVGLAVFVMTSLLISGTTFAAGNAGKGQSLFAGSKCNTCHGTEMYTSKDRKVKNLKDLEAAVRLNDSKLNTNWFDEDVKDVTAYLNQQYYKF